MHYTSESKEKETHAKETERDNTASLFQRDSQGGIGTSSSDEWRDLSAEGGYDRLFAFIREAHLEEAQVFRKKGYNSQVPEIDGSLLTQLRHDLATAKNRLCLRVSVGGALSSRWQLEQIGNIERLTNKLSDDTIKDWIEHELPRKNTTEASKSKLGSRRTAQSLARRLESTLQTLIRVVRTLREIDDYNPPEKWHDMLGTELISAFSSSDKSMVIQALESMKAETSGHAAWDSLMQVRAEAREAGKQTSIKTMIAASQQEAEKANTKARNLQGEPQTFFSNVSAYLLNFSDDLAKSLIQSSLSTTSSAIPQVNNDEAPASLSRSNTFSQNFKTSLDKTKLQVQTAFERITVYRRSLVRSVKYGHFTKTPTKTFDQVVADSIIRSILWQWQQPAIKIQYASTALLSKLDELKKIEGILASSSVVDGRGSEQKRSDILVSSSSEENLVAKVREWVNHSLEQESPENQRAVKVETLEQLLDADIGYAQSLLARLGNTTDSIQEMFKRQWISVDDMLETKLPVDIVRSLWKKIDHLVEQFMPDIAEELATAAQALNGATLTARSGSSARDLSKAQEQADKAQLLATNVKERLSAESARLTERPLDEHSRGSRLAKHWANLAKEQNVDNYPTPDAQQVLASLKEQGLLAETLSSGDPVGYLFATRLAGELENARNDELRLPMSPEQYAALEKGLVEYIVKWGQRRISREGTRIIIELSFEQALDAVSFSVSSFLRLPYKILKATIKVPYSVNKVNNYTMPGQDKPYKAIYGLLEKKLKQLGFNLLTAPVPGSIKLVAGAVVTAGAVAHNRYAERREKTFNAVYQKVAEGVPSKKIKMDSIKGMAVDSVFDATTTSVFKGGKRYWKSGQSKNNLISANVSVSKHIAENNEKTSRQMQWNEMAAGNDTSLQENAAAVERRDMLKSYSLPLQQQPDVERLSDEDTYKVHTRRKRDVSDMTVPQSPQENYTADSGTESRHTRRKRDVVDMTVPQSYQANSETAYDDILDLEYADLDQVTSMHSRVDDDQATSQSTPMVDDSQVNLQSTPEVFIANLNQQYGLQLSANTQVEVYHTEGRYGTKTLDLKTALENSNGNIIAIRYPAGCSAEAIKALDNYLMRNALPDKMSRLAGKMSAKRWIRYIEFKHQVNIGDPEVEVNYNNGQYGNLNLSTALNTDDSNIGGIDYLESWPAEVSDELDFYLNSRELMRQDRDEQIVKENAEFQRTIASYLRHSGDDSTLEQQIRDNELPESSRSAWHDIKETQSSLKSALDGKKSFTEVLSQIDQLIGEKKEQIDDEDTTDEDEQSLRNSIAYLNHEKEIYIKLEKECSDSITYLTSNNITFFEEPTVRIQESLILAFKMKYPSESEGLSDKQVYDKAIATLTNKENDPEKAQDLANTHRIIYYLSDIKKEWKNSDTDITDANTLYAYVVDSGKNPPSVNSIHSAFTDALKSPAPEYTGLAELKPIWEFWDQTDSAFYEHIEDYKKYHAKNEAMDDIYRLAIDAGMYPQDLHSPPVAFKTFKIDVPVEEVRLSETIKTITGDFNHYNTEKGNVTLFQTQSGEYWCLSTISNNKSLIKINKSIFDKYSATTEFDSEKEVKAFFSATGVSVALLPEPKTTSTAAKAVSTLDSVISAPYRLGRWLGGHSDRTLLPDVPVEQRYYKVTATGGSGTPQSKSINTLMIEDATATNKAVADDKKKFSSFDRRTLPGNWKDLSPSERLLRAMSNTWGHIKDFNLALFAPLEVSVRSLEDPGYEPSAEDKAQAYFDLGLAVTTLGIGTVAKSAQATKKAIELVKQARTLGLKGHSFKQFLFKGMQPFIKSAATSAVKAPLREVFPAYDMADMAVSLGKKPTKVTTDDLVSDQKPLISSANIKDGPDTLPATGGNPAISSYTQGRWQSTFSTKGVASQVPAQVDTNGPWNLVSTPGDQPDTVYIYAHGTSIDEGFTTPAPNDMTITFATPHRTTAMSPGGASVMHDEVTPYATVNGQNYTISVYKDPEKTTLVPQSDIRQQLLDWKEKLFLSQTQQDRLLATGTTEAGEVSNYYLRPLNGATAADNIGRDDFITYIDYNRLAQNPANESTMRQVLGLKPSQTFRTPPKMDFLYLEPGSSGGKLEQVIEIAKEKGYKKVTLTHCRVKVNETNPISYEVNVSRPRGGMLATNEPLYEVTIDIESKRITLSPMVKAASGNEQDSNVNEQQSHNIEE